MGRPVVLKWAASAQLRSFTASVQLELCLPDRSVHIAGGAHCLVFPNQLYRGVWMAGRRTNGFRTQKMSPLGRRLKRVVRCPPNLKRPLRERGAVAAAARTAPSARPRWGWGWQEQVLRARAEGRLLGAALRDRQDSSWTPWVLSTSQGKPGM